MRDFKALVRGRLASIELPRDRELAIVDEWSSQLEDIYESLLARGVSDEAAWEEVAGHLPDANALATDLIGEEPVAARLAHPQHAPFAGDRKASFSRHVRAVAGVGVLQDLTSAFRLMVKAPGFAAATILTLAVCLGANAAIFTVVHSVVLRPLPVPDADRIIALGDVYPTVTPNDILSNTVPSYFDRLAAVTTLEDQSLFTRWSDTISTRDGSSEAIEGLRATPSFFRLVRVAPALGRAFVDADAEQGASPAIILSDGLWRRLFAADPSAIGRDLRLGWTGQRYTIVGVMPRGFSFFDPDVEFWIPLIFTPAQRTDDARTRYGFFHAGRLTDGASLEQVQAQVDAVNATLFARFPQFGLSELGMYTSVTTLQEALTRSVRSTLYLLWAGSACVLLIGVLNVTNLSLARSSARARELATRIALGASRARVARQLATEGVVMSGVAFLGSLIVSAMIGRWLSADGLASIPNASDIRLDSTVVAMTAAIAVIVGLTIGLLPATILRRSTLTHALADGSRLGTSGRTARTFRRSLIVVQVACSVVLLVGATLLLVSFRNLLSADGGFSKDRVATASFFPPPSRYADQKAIAVLSDRLLTAVRKIPGVDAAGITSNIALSGHASPSSVSDADRAPEPGAAPIVPSVMSVTPGYFDAMSTPIVRGRGFAESDREGSMPVAIVDQRLASRLWPGEDPIGKSVVRGQSQRYTIVGVAQDVRFESLSGTSDMAGAAYFPHAQAPVMTRLRWIAIKARSDEAGLLPSLRAAVRSIDPDLPLSDVQTMTERTARSLVPQRLAMSVAGLFGGVALFLSVLGIYGVLTFVVVQRTREIAIRIALGSTARRTFRLVFAEGFVLITCGLAIGLAGAIALARALESQVFGVRPTDPVVLGLVLVGTGAVALGTCAWPARRASRVNPIAALNGK